MYAVNNVTKLYLWFEWKYLSKKECISREAFRVYLNCLGLSDTVLMYEGRWLKSLMLK